MAEHLPRYINTLGPEYIFIENVVEFMSWGPLVPKMEKTPDGYEACKLRVVKKKGKVISVEPHYIPESRTKGRDFIRWKQGIEAMGFNYEHQILNSANYGAMTKRIRYFAQFAREGYPIAWPEATHTKDPSKGMFGELKKWVPVKHALQLDDHGQSIFTREKPLVEATLARIYAGLQKFVANGKDDTFFSQRFGGDPKSKITSIHEPSRTITGSGAILTNPKLNVVTVKNGWLMNAQFKNVGTSLDEPAATITADRHHQYLMNPQFANKGGSIEEPGFTLIARMDKAPPHLVTVQPGNVIAIAIYETDSPMMVKIKEFMAAYGIVDIMMRMLHVPELLQIQGFPKGYYLAGTKTDQKKFIGNSVPPPMAEAIVMASALANLKHKRQLKLVA